MARATVSRNGSATRSAASGADGLWRPSRWSFTLGFVLGEEEAREALSTTQNILTQV